MYLDEFIQYVERNCNAQDIFLNKANDYQLEINATRQKSARWSQSKIDKECEKMWDAAIRNTYNSVATNIKSNKEKPRFANRDDEVDYWVEFLNEYEFLESFTDGISDTEFD